MLEFREPVMAFEMEFPSYEDAVEYVAHRLFKAAATFGYEVESVLDLHIHQASYHYRLTATATMRKIA